MASSRIVDFLAGCVVGGALIAVGLVMGKRASGSSDLQVVMLKDDTTATVWEVDRTSGKARFVSSSMIPMEAAERMSVEATQRLGAMWARMGSVDQMGQKLFSGIAEGAARERIRQTNAR